MGADDTQVEAKIALDAMHVQLLLERLFRENEKLRKAARAVVDIPGHLHLADPRLRSAIEELKKAVE